MPAKFFNLWFSMFLISFAKSNSSEIVNDTIFIATKSVDCATITSSPHCIQLARKFFVINPFEKANWHEADRLCRRQNAHLATIETDEEMTAINEYLPDLYKKYPSNNRYWLSGNDFGSVGTYYSLETGKPITYTKWSRIFDILQPDSDKEHCLNLLYWKNYYAMNDDSCEYETPFICQLEGNSHKGVVFGNSNDWKIEGIQRNAKFVIIVN